MTLDEFVEAQRSKRAAAGLPAKITEPSIYRLIEGVLAAHRDGEAKQ